MMRRGCCSDACLSQNLRSATLIRRRSQMNRTRQSSQHTRNFLWDVMGSTKGCWSGVGVRDVVEIDPIVMQQSHRQWSRPHLPCSFDNSHCTSYPRSRLFNIAYTVDQTYAHTGAKGDATPYPCCRLRVVPQMSLTLHEERTPHDWNPGHQVFRQCTVGHRAMCCGMEAYDRSPVPRDCRPIMEACTTLIRSPDCELVDVPLRK